MLKALSSYTIISTFQLSFIDRKQHVKLLTISAGHPNLQDDEKTKVQVNQPWDWKSGMIYGLAASKSHISYSEQSQYFFLYH